MTKRHALVLEKRALEGHTEPVSRQGDYDGLNYAPIRQVQLTSALATTSFASQRARKMAQLAANQKSGSNQSRQVKRSSVKLDSSLEKSLIFEQVDEIPQPSMKTRRTLQLDSQDELLLGEVLNEASKDDKSLVVIKATSTPKVEGSMEYITLDNSFINALDEEWTHEIEEYGIRKRYIFRKILIFKMNFILCCLFLLVSWCWNHNWSVFHGIGVK